MFAQSIVVLRPFLALFMRSQSLEIAINIDAYKLIHKTSDTDPASQALRRFLPTCNYADNPFKILFFCSPLATSTHETLFSSLSLLFPFRFGWFFVLLLTSLS
jgi:hypothetical protein